MTYIVFVPGDAGEVGGDVVERDRLRPRRHPARGDHHRQPLDEARGSSRTPRCPCRRSSSARRVVTGTPPQRPAARPSRAGCAGALEGAPRRPKRQKDLPGRRSAARPRLPRPRRRSGGRCDPAARSRATLSEWTRQQATSALAQRLGDALAGGRIRHDHRAPASLRGVRDRRPSPRAGLGAAAAPWPTTPVAPKTVTFTAGSVRAGRSSVADGGMEGTLALEVEPARPAGCARAGSEPRQRHPRPRRSSLCRSPRAAARGSPSRRRGARADRLGSRAGRRRRRRRGSAPVARR